MQGGCAIAPRGEGGEEGKKGMRLWERMRKIEQIREGVRRRYFRENSGPDDVLDCGIHSGRKFEDVYLDHKSYVKWVLELGQLNMWSLRCISSGR